MLVIVAGCMTVFIAAAALAIDLGSFYHTQTRAQNAADAAALAASQGLPGTASTATSIANSYVQANLPGATATIATPYSGDSTKVQVIVNASAQSIFGGFLGLTKANVTASAVATSDSTATAIAGPIFAASTSCSAITLQNNNNATVGGIVTNGGVSVSGSNGTTVSSLSHGPGCTTGAQPGVTITNTTTNSGTVPFPIDYRTQTITCNSGQTVTGLSGSSPTYNTSNITFNNSQTVSGVYCAQTINLANSAQLTGSATFIADNFGGGISDTGTLTPYFNDLQLWQTGSSTLQLDSTTFINGGVVFAPSAEILVNSQSLTGNQTTFLEASTVFISSMNGGSLQAPSGLTSGSTSSGSSLTQ